MSVDQANVKISALANLMKAKKKDGKSFVVLLGAGASISSGVSPTDTMMLEIVDKFGDSKAGDFRERFDKLWTKSSEQNRQIFLREYLDKQPSQGYHHLVDLVSQGYIDTIITFNFDNLLETAFMNANLRDGFDYKVIVRGDYKDDRVVTMMAATDPRVKILKLHGSLRGGDTFLFSQNEMSGYPDEINALVRRLTSGDILVCGYGFADLCVIRAFSDLGESIHCVNPSGVPPMLKGFLVRRRSEDNVTDGEDGKFDAYFAKLHAALTRHDGPKAKPSLNPFKFFDGYEPGEKQWLFGRRALTRKVLAKLPKVPAQVPAQRLARVVPVIGQAKVGKTSFMRAGLLPYLDPELYFPVYVRCSRDIEESLPEILKTRLNVPTVSGDIPATLRSLAVSQPNRHVVLVLDQFERVVAKYQTRPKDLNACVKSLSESGCDNITVIPVGETDAGSRFILCLNDLRIDYLYVPPLEPRSVGRIVQLIAKKAGARFDPAVIVALRTRYEESFQDEHKSPFTLTHVQAICNLLVEDALSGGELDETALGGVIREHLESLNRAINQVDILSFVEDFPLEEQRALLCRILRIVAEPGRTKIAEYLRANLPNLLRPRGSHLATGQQTSATHG